MNDQELTATFAFQAIIDYLESEGETPESLRTFALYAIGIQLGRIATALENKGA